MLNFDLLLKIQVGLFGNFDSISTTPKVISEIFNLYKDKNFIPSTEYEEILRGLTLFTLNSSFNKIINLTTSKEKINIYKKEDVE